jgi:TRAP-type C4-dicarboxylate transport system permease small subunit
MDDAKKNKLERVHRARKAVQKQMVGYIATALGLIAGLAWNDAIKDLITKLFPLGSDSITAKFVYAVVLTIVVAVGLYFLQKMVANEDE